MIIIVIHSPPREAHYLDLPPLCLHIAYILHISYYIKRYLYFSLFYICILNFEIFQPLPLQARLVRPRALNLQFTNLHNFSGGKGLKAGGGMELAGLPVPPTSHTLYLYPFHPFPTFPLPKLYCWTLRNSP